MDGGKCFDHYSNLKQLVEIYKNYKEFSESSKWNVETMKGILTVQYNVKQTSVHDFSTNQKRND